MADGVIPAPQAQGGQNPLLGVLGGIGGAIGSAVSLPFSVLSGIGSEYAAIPQAIALRQAQQRAQFAALQRQMAGLSEVRAGLSNPQEIAMFDADPAGYLSSRTDVWKSQNTPTNTKAGESIITPATGQMLTAPEMTLTPSGVGVTQTPTATTITGSVPTIQSAPAGTTVSGMAPIGPAAATAPGIGGAPNAPTGSLAVPDSFDVGTTLGQGGAPAPNAVAPSGAPVHGPRGIRNNNWGNLTALPNGQQWAGQTGVDSGGYVVFGTPQDGLKAAITNLRAYGSHHGIDTIQGVANRWAPARGGNDPVAYAHNVANAMGVGVNDRLDMTNPQVLNGLVHGISIAENGKHAIDQALAGPQASAQLQAAPAPTGASAPTPAPATPGGLPTSIAGKTSQDISPAEALALGLAPGRWQRDPTGKVVQISAPPKEDLDRMTSLSATVDHLRSLVAEQTHFAAHNKNFATGPGYSNPEAHGVHLNPVASYLESSNPHFQAMEGSAGNQLFLVKPANAGARILQSELPYWETQTQSPGKTGDVNGNILSDNRGKFTRAMAQQAFYQTWLYKKGSLQGADTAWGHYLASPRGKTALGSSPAATSQPSAQPTAGGLQTGHVEDGFRYNGGDPHNPASWSRAAP